MTNTSGAGKAEKTPEPEVQVGDWSAALADFTGGLACAKVEWDADEVLETFVSLAHQASGAASTCFYSPSLDGTWVCEAERAVEDSGRDPMLGRPLSLPESALQNLGEGSSIEVGDLLCFPIFSDGALDGCVAFLKQPGFSPRTPKQLRDAQTFVNAGSLALEMVGAQQSRDLATLLEERERIGRDLHDLGIQELFAVGMGLRALKAEVERGDFPRDVAERLESALEGLESAITQIRAIVGGLQTSARPTSFAEALHLEASKARSHLGFAPTVTLEVDEQSITDTGEFDTHMAEEVECRLHEELQTDVIAVLREALTNVAKHAGARSVQVGVCVHGTGPSGEIEVVILDDGAGVDPSVSRSSGLANMQARATAHGGSFAVSPGPRGRGTSIVWRSPLQ